jgi:cell division septum initiation protein DivIVA
MDRMRQRMDAVSFEADLSDPDPVRTIKQKPKPAAPEPKKDAEPPKPAEAPTGDLDLEDAPAVTEPKPEEPPAEKPPELLDENGKPVDRKKTSPWKLTEKLNAKNRDLMRELVELKEKMGKATNLEQELKRIETVEARNKELEEEIKYQNYSKSSEFTEKYQKPYEAAWAKAAKELAEIEVLDESGAVARRANSQDLIALANMPLGQARKTANAMFGDSANDVMLHRQRIIDLSEAQREALDNSRKAGTDREQQWSAKHQAITKEVGTLWEAANTEAASKLEYLKAKEGDTEWNGALDKAKSLVDTAFSQSPADPNLSPEQRAKVVKSHAAIRNRAIAYSTLKTENSRLKAELAKRDEKLKQFEDSEPTAGNGSREAAQAQQPADPMARAMQRLQKSAVAAPNNFF